MRTSEMLFPFAMIAILIVMAGCSSFGTKQNAQEHTKEQALACIDCNVILVSLDTLRADRLGMYGYERNTSPHLDRRVEKAIIFENHFVNGYFTLPSHMSIFTSTYPLAHHINEVRSEINGHVPILSPDIPTMAEILKGHGYHTLWIAPLNSTYLDFERGFERGFDAYYASMFWGTRELDYGVLEQAMASSNNTKFFWFVHSYVDHTPYIYPEPFNSKFTDGRYAGKIPLKMATLAQGQFNMVHSEYMKNSTFLANEINALNIPDIWKSTLLLSLEKNDPQPYLELAGTDVMMHSLIMNSRKALLTTVFEKTVTFNLSREDISQLRGGYDNGVSYADHLLEEMLGILERKGMLNNTLIIITSDHGEDLYEHGRLFHDTFYDTVSHAPFIVISPSFDRQIRVNSLSEGVDILPTVLSLLNLSSPSSLQGKSQLKVLRNEVLPSNFVYGYSQGNIYIRSKEWKYIKNRDGSGELYHLPTDPGEHENLIAGETKGTNATIGLLEGELLRWQIAQSLH
jgi:arylsulfatase A-like enzyme